MLYNNSFNIVKGFKMMGEGMLPLKPIRRRRTFHTMIFVYRNIALRKIFFKNDNAGFSMARYTKPTVVHLYIINAGLLKICVINFY